MTNARDYERYTAEAAAAADKQARTASEAVLRAQAASMAAGERASRAAKSAATAQQQAVDAAACVASGGSAAAAALRAGPRAGPKGTGERKETNTDVVVAGGFGDKTAGGNSTGGGGGGGGRARELAVKAIAATASAAAGAAGPRKRTGASGGDDPQLDLGRAPERKRGLVAGVFDQDALQKLITAPLCGWAKDVETELGPWEVSASHPRVNEARNPGRLPPPRCSRSRTLSLLKYFSLALCRKYVGRCRLLTCRSSAIVAHPVGQKCNFWCDVAWDSTRYLLR